MTGTSNNAARTASRAALSPRSGATSGGSPGTPKAAAPPAAATGPTCFCGNCGTKSAGGSKFCANCGSSVDGTFCGECGAKVVQTSQSSSSSTWSVTFVNLPAVPGQPAKFSVGNSVAFSSEGNRNRVNASFTTPTGVGQTNLVNLDLPAVGFNYNRNLAVGEGTHIRFQADENGTLKVRRQHHPF